MPTSLIIRFPVLVVLAATLLLSGCGRAKRQAPPEPPTVGVVQPVEREIVEWDEYTGRLASPETVEVRARVSGYLESIHFRDGQIVEKGDLLFVIDPRPYEAALNQAQAALRQADAQQTLAASNFERAQQLRQRGVIAQEEIDTTANQFKQAQAAVEAARAREKAAKLDLDFTRIEAPIRGRISRNYVSIGNLVTGGSANTTLLTTVVSLDPIYCYFEVDERSFLTYQQVIDDAAHDPSAARTPIMMAVGREEGFPHEGVLDFVDNRVDPASATVELRGVFFNPELKLTPGLFARVKIPASKKHTAILVPDQAIGTDQNQQFVYVIGPDNKAAYRKVQLGPMADALRVVRTGIEPRERVVVTGMHSMRPGLEVKPEEKRIDEVLTFRNGGPDAKTASPAPVTAPATPRAANAR